MSFGVLLALSRPVLADPCGTYPSCNEGLICEGHIAYVCKAKDGKCGPWSKIDGCPFEQGLPDTKHESAGSVKVGADPAANSGATPAKDETGATKAGVVAH